jgi:hypothetical protein
VLLSLVVRIEAEAPSVYGHANRWVCGREMRFVSAHAFLLHAFFLPSAHALEMHTSLPAVLHGAVAKTAPSALPA